MKNVPVQENCCCDRPKPKNKKTLACPVSGKRGQSVDSETLRYIIKETSRSEIKGAGYYFCKSPDCDTVYYRPESGQTFEKTDLNVRVGLKETEDPVWVCYCFDITKKMIREEVEGLGHSVSKDRIRQEVSDGNCDCEIKNPSGRCCLGEIVAAEKEAQKILKESPFRKNVEH